MLTPAAASAAPGFKLGLFDDSQTFGNTSEAFANYGALGVDVLRITMHWNDVAPTRPVNPADPADPAYRWSEYDRVAIQAAERGIGLVVTIMGAPPWANGGKSPAVVPSKARGLRKFSRQLKKFARAAARRYSGAEAAKYAALPVIDKWVAWNEPNLRNFLKPQYIRVKSKGGKRKFVRRSPVLYASICKAIYRGVHQSGRELGVDEQVACGVTAPGGNNNPRSSRPSISPILFLRDLKRSGAKFDAYGPLETPADRPTVRTRITLGSIWRLLRELEDLYSADIPLWITEYGYQTNPPDTISACRARSRQSTLITLLRSCLRTHESR